LNDPGANKPRRDRLVPFELATVRADSVSTLGPDNDAASDDSKRFRFAVEPRRRLTHYLFRFPAKFHPPVARALVNGYTKPGDRVLDPFCGSGSLLVEAAVAGRNAIGTDVDPLAVFVSRAKTRVYDLANIEVLQRSCNLG